MIKIGVIYGGRSGEHEVSLASAASVIKALDLNKYEVVAIGIDKKGRWYVQEKPVIKKDKFFGEVLDLKQSGEWTVNFYGENYKLVLKEFYSQKVVKVDLVFPVVHGTFSEDGTLQGLLELAMVPFVGAGTAASVIGIDKDLSKRLLREAGISVVPWQIVDKIDWQVDRDKVLEKLNNLFPFPFFIKPAKTGSSVGVEKIKRSEDIPEALEMAFSFDSRILVEEGIEAREIEGAVLGNEQPKVSVLGEIIPEADFYSYQAKYLNSDQTVLVIPAEIDSALASEIRQVALKAYKVLNGQGMARVDFFLEKKSNQFYLNEINTIPGFTKASMYPKLWEKTGLKYSDLLDKLIALALASHQERIKIKTDYN